MSRRTMKTRRPISINNSLVHGICNYSCRLCGIGKKGYSGPREFQPHEVTRALVRRVRDASAAGIRIRYIANSGDGEPTLHPEFAERMEMYGEMLRTWEEPVPPPEVSMVTNGSLLASSGKADILAENGISLIISFPTCHPESYGLIMKGDRGTGEELFEAATAGIGQAMEMRAAGRLPALYFHVSPPEREIIRRDFRATLELLTTMGKKRRLERLELVLFPAVSNRSGLLRSIGGSIDTYRDLFRLYNGRTMNGVRIGMRLVLKRFFSGPGELVDLVRSFRFPCLWNANFFISSDGSSICCNDQWRLHPQGNILTDSLQHLMAAKEEFLPGSMCAGCNQAPQKMRGSPAASVFSIAARARMFLSRGSSRKQPRPDSTPAATCGNAPEAEPVLAKTVEEMGSAFHLLYDSYMDSGLQDPNDQELRIVFHNLLPSGYPVLVRNGERTVGTMTLFRRGMGKLPMDGLFEEELERVAEKDSCFCELSGLAVDRRLVGGSRQQILLSLFRKTFILGSEVLGCTDFCMMVNPRHADYYKLIFNFRVIGEMCANESVRGAPAVPLWLNLAEGRRILRKTRYDMWEYFFGKDIPALTESTLAEMSGRSSLYGPGFVGRIGSLRSGILEGLPAEKLDILDGYYPEWRRELP